MYFTQQAEEKNQQQEYFFKKGQGKLLLTQSN